MKVHTQHKALVINSGEKLSCPNLWISVRVQLQKVTGSLPIKVTDSFIFIESIKFQSADWFIKSSLFFHQCKEALLLSIDICVSSNSLIL